LVIARHFRERFSESSQYNLKVSDTFKLVLEASGDLKQLWEGLRHLVEDSAKCFEKMALRTKYTEETIMD